MKQLEYKNGDQMPILGLGTWKSEPGEVYLAVKEAIKIGYRHIDCAPIYENEPEVGNAFTECFNEGIVKREDLWVTSKLWNNAHLKGDVVPALKKTLKDLDLEYLDLFLVHWPVAQKPDSKMPGPDGYLSLDEAPLQDTWEGMMECVDQGLTKHVGVSNFNISHLESLLGNRIAPEMNQVELHPYLQQNKLVNFCHDNGVHVTAYSPLGSPDRPAAIKGVDEVPILQDATVSAIADKHGVSNAQVLIAWAINRNTSVIPKSVNPARIKQNLDAAEVQLSPEDMNAINGLDKHARYVDGSFWTGEGSPYTLEDLWG